MPENFPLQLPKHTLALRVDEADVAKSEASFGMLIYGGGVAGKLEDGEVKYGVGDKALVNLGAMKLFLVRGERYWLAGYTAVRGKVSDGEEV